MKTIDYGVARVRLSTLADAKFLAPRLRPEDVQEVRAVGKTPLSALKAGVRLSKECYTVETKDGPVAMFGVTPTHDPVLGLVWLLGSPDLLKIKLTFLRHSRTWLKNLFGDFRLVGNIVDSRNELHTHWLRWLGFRMIRPVHVAPGIPPFLEFAKFQDP
jgi:hypothetical protein